MNNTVIASLIILGFIALIAFMFFIMIRGATRWGTELGEILASLGLYDSPEDKDVLAPHLKIVNERHSSKRLIMHLYRYTSIDKDYKLYFCDYRFSSASGKASGSQQLVVCLISKKLTLPRFTIEPIPQQTGTTGKILRAIANAFPLPGLHTVQTTNPSFNQRYTLYVAKEQTQTKFLPDTITNRLISSEGIYLDAKNDTLTLRSLDVDYRKLDTQNISDLISLAKKLFDDFSH